MITNNPFNGKKEINVVFIGGSITEGYFSSTKETCYAGICSKWFKDTFNTQKVNCYNVGIGATASNFAMIRMERDVMSHDPDMIFIEFAVNDGGKDLRACMESLVRRAMKSEKNPYIVFLYTANNTYTTVTSFHEEVATHYGIPQINLQEALKNALCGANPTEVGALADSVHPRDMGFKIYADTIISRLEDGSAFIKPTQNEPLCSNTPIIDATFTPSTKLQHSAGWIEKTHHMGYECLYTENAGETVELEFDGNMLHIETGRHKETGILEVVVDGNHIADIDSYFDVTTYHFLYREITFDLPKGHHKVKFTLKENPTTELHGTKYMIYHIITGTVDYYPKA